MGRQSLGIDEGAECRFVGWHLPHGQQYYVLSFLDGWHRFGRYSGIITRKLLSALRYEVRVILTIVCAMPLFADCSFENVFQESNLGGRSFKIFIRSRTS